jgi:WD40 repeat protein
MAAAWQCRPVTLTGHQGVVYAAAFSPEGKRVVTASDVRLSIAEGGGEHRLLHNPQRFNT